jgi:hypothetical protein
MGLVAPNLDRIIGPRVVVGVQNQQVGNLILFASGADFASQAPQDRAGQFYVLLWPPEIKLSMWVSIHGSSRE